MEATRRRSLYGFEMREPDLRRTERKSVHDIKQLWQRSHEILALALRGMNNKDIAKTLSIHPVTVTNTMNSELGMKKLSAMREERDADNIKVSKRIAELVHKACDTYDAIFDAQTFEVSHELKKQTADTIMLEIAGYAAPKRIESRSMTAVATIEEIEEFKRRGMAAARESGMLVEIPGERT